MGQVARGNGEAAQLVRGELAQPLDIEQVLTAVTQFCLPDAH